MVVIVIVVVMVLVLDYLFTIELNRIQYLIKPP